MNYEGFVPYDYYRLCEDVPEPELADEDEEWWENAESEVAALDREEQR